MKLHENTLEALARRMACGLNTLQIGEIKEKNALDWLYRWGYSWPSVLEQINGTAGNRLTSRLEKNKLITSMVPEAAGMKNVPKKIVLLTKRGLEVAESFQKKLIPYELRPSRIRQTHIRHDVLGQRATANMLGPDFSFETEREMAAMSKKGVKQPDILWNMNGKRVSIEVELSMKTNREFDQFIFSTINSLIARNDRPPRFDKMILMSTSESILEKYALAFEPGMVFNVWARDGNGNNASWQIIGKRLVPIEIDGKIECRFIDLF
jgi:hypothetical protein